MNVFISYAVDDKSRISKVIGELKSKEVVEDDDQIVHAPDVFVPGSSPRGLVRKAMEAASKVVIVWSGTGAGSTWVNYETGMAEALGKPIFLAIPKGEKSRLPQELKDIQIIELENIS